MRKYLFEDAVIISYPRSGRAWILTIMENIQKKLAIKCPLIRHSHDGMAKLQVGRPTPVRDKAVYKDEHVFLLVRNPCDVIVSLWHMLNYRWQKHNLKMPLSDFFKHELGLRYLISWMNEWAKQRSKAKSFHVLFYESLDIGIIFSSLQKRMNPHVIEEAVSGARLENVRAKFPWSNSGGNGPEGWAARRGEANVWREYLSADDIQWAEEALRWLDEYWKVYKCQ